MEMEPDSTVYILKSPTDDSYFTYFDSYTSDPGLQINTGDRHYAYRFTARELDKFFKYNKDMLSWVVKDAATGKKEKYTCE